MAQLIVMYKTPKDPEVFQNHYFKTHIPLARKIPGLRKLEISQGTVATPAGPSEVHLIAILHFDDLSAIQKAFASAEGRAAAADAQTLAPVEMFVFDSREV